MDRRQDKKMDNKEIAEYVATLSARAMSVPSDGIKIEDLPIKMKLLLQSDILLPVIVTMANYLGDSLLDATNQYGAIFPFDLQKSEDTLCYVKLVENNKKSAPLSIQILLTMEVCDILFKPSFDNVIDLTSLVKNWREHLAEIPNDRVININEFHNNLIGNSMNYIVKNISANKPYKSK